MQFRRNTEKGIRACRRLFGLSIIFLLIWTLLLLWVLAACSESPFIVMVQGIGKPLIIFLSEISLLFFALCYFPALTYWWYRDDVLTLDTQGIVCNCARTPKGLWRFMRNLIQLHDSWQVSWEEIKTLFLYRPGFKFALFNETPPGYGCLFVETRDKRLLMLNLLNAWQPVTPSETLQIQESSQHPVVLREIESWLKQIHPGENSCAIKRVGYLKAHLVFIPRTKRK